MQESVLRDGFDASAAHRNREIITTASDVLFSDDMERYFFALKDRDCKLLWKTSLSASVNSAAHNLRDNGRQFVAVACDVRLCLPQQ